MLEKLLILQDRDRRIFQMNREIKDIPVRKAEIESRLNSYKEALQKAQDSVQQCQASMDQDEIEIESLKEKITKYRQQQFEIKNNEEYRALEKEIYETKQAIKKLEDNEILHMEAKEAAQAVVAERQKDIEHQESIVREDMKAFEGRLSAIEEQLQDQKKKRDEIASEIDPDLVRRYTRIFENKGDRALVPVENGACGGCHMKLPPQLVTDAKKKDQVTTCVFCGRILYSR